MIFPRMSLHCMLVPVQYREYEYGLPKCAWHAFNVRTLQWSLCCVLERNFTLTALLSTQVYKWEPGNCRDNHTRCIFCMHYNYITNCNRFFCACKIVQHFTYLHIALFNIKNNSATVEPL